MFIYNSFGISKSFKLKFFYEKKAKWMTSVLIYFNIKDICIYICKIASSKLSNNFLINTNVFNIYFYFLCYFTMEYTRFF